MNNSLNKNSNKNSDFVAELNALANQFFLGTKGETPTLPHAFLPLLSGVPAEQHALFALALYSQATALAVRPIPTDQTGSPATLTPFAPLPTPDLPILDKSLHSLAKRLAHTCGQGLLTLTAHKGVLLPAPIALPILKDTVPTAYQAWKAWLDNPTTRPKIHPTDHPLSYDDWDELTLQDKITFIKQQRQAKSPALLPFLKENLKHATPDHRFKLIYALIPTLSKDDIEFLTDLQKDKSKKVGEFATQLLTRLGVIDETSKELAGELAEHFELKGKKLGVFGKKSLIAKRLKTNEQNQKRNKQLEVVHLPSFANALTLSLNELIELWDFANKNHYELNTAFIKNAVATFNDDEFNLLFKNWLNFLKNDCDNFFDYSVFISNTQERLSTEQLKLAYHTLFCCHTFLEYENNLNQITLPFDLSLTDFKKAKTYNELMAYLKQDLDLHIAYKKECLQILGLLLPFDCAEYFYQTLIGMGVDKYNEALLGLEFNIKLNALLNAPVTQN